LDGRWNLLRQSEVSEQEQRVETRWTRRWTVGDGRFHLHRQMGLMQADDRLLRRMERLRERGRYLPQAD